MSGSYSLRYNHKNRINAAAIKFPFNRNREYLTRCVKSQLLTRKGHLRWMQGVQPLDQEEYFKVKKILYKGKKRGRKPFYKLELSYPDNEIQLVIKMQSDDSIRTEDVSQVESINDDSNQEMNTTEEQTTRGSPTAEEAMVLFPAVTGDPELDGPPFEIMDSLVEFFHNYCLNSDTAEDDGTETNEPTKAKHPKHKATESAKEPSGDAETKSKEVKGKLSWQERLIRKQKYSHIIHVCTVCNRTFRGLNVLRHALSHMKKKRKICVLCGQRFKEFSLASKHIEEHIEEMSKRRPAGDVNTTDIIKSCKKKDKNHVTKPREESTDETKPVPESDTSQPTPSANGTETPTVPEPPEDDTKQDENPKSAVSEQPKSASKPKPCRFKFTEMKREERIARHVHNLFKKRYFFSKFNQNVVPPDFVLSDEQVVIKGNMVILKNIPMRPEGVNGENEKMKEGKDEEAENAAEQEREEKEQEVEGKKKTGEGGEDCAEKGKEKDEADFVIKNLVYYLCPGNGCDKVFYKIGHTMTKHAMKYHLTEENIQELIFSWSKQKCILCHRQFHLLPHFKGHMRLHLEHPQYFCYHQGCGKRFDSFQEARNHEAQHMPLRPQCTYTACENVFNNMFALGDHEWRHYIPTPLKSEFDGANRGKRHSEEAPWKQRIRVEELWLQNKTPPKEEINLKLMDKEVKNDIKNNAYSDTVNEDAFAKIFNGCNESQPPKQTSSKHKPPPPESDPINVKNRSEDIMIADICEPSGAEVPLIEEHKTFKASDPAYKPLFKAPLLRPPPSMYMSESELSMRKRKAAQDASAAAPKTLSWNQRRHQPAVVETAKPKPEAEPKIRHRCEKCLSFFSSPEELMKHKSLNTCSALFGFDSDDES